MPSWTRKQDGGKLIELLGSRIQKIAFRIIEGIEHELKKQGKVVVEEVGELELVAA